MDHADEFDLDIFDGFKEVVDALTSPKQEHILLNLNSLDQKIFDYHIHRNTFLLKKVMESRVRKRKTKIPHRFNLNKFLKGKQSIQSMTVYDYNQQSNPENVFFCLRRIDDTRIKVFFVSKEYNVNFASDSLTNPFPARFVFSKEQFLLAIAEILAKEVDDYSQKDIENLYMERRRGKQPSNHLSFVHLTVLLFLYLKEIFVIL